MGGWWHQETKSAFQMFHLGTPKKVQTCFSGSAPPHLVLQGNWGWSAECAQHWIYLKSSPSLSRCLKKASPISYSYHPTPPHPRSKKRVWPPPRWMLPLPPPLLVVVVGSVFCTYLEDVQGQVLLKSKKPSAKGCKGKGRGPSQNGWGISDEGSSK